MNTVNNLKEKIQKKEEKKSSVDLNGLSAYQQEIIESARNDLQNFSYTVSHDLRAPLRAIDGFSKVLDQKLRGKINEEEERYMNIILENVQKMGRLIDDLLSYYRIGRQEKKVSTIDMELLIYSAFQDLIKGMKLKNSPELKMNQLPPMVADRELMAQLAVQILDNALKFSRHRQNIVIEVNGKLEKDRAVYSFRDNGIGFEMEYLDKVFGIFQRLHSEDEFEGTGIGLAIVQRIVKIHHGKTWAESSKDKGAIFYISIPIDQFEIP